MQIIKKPLIFFVLTLIFIGVSQQIDLRKDLTVDQRYTLSDETVNYLKALEAPVRVDIFLTGELPGLYRDLRGELDVFLNQLKFYADELIIEYNDPFEIGSNQQVIQEMQLYGMTPEIVIENKNGQRKESIVFPWMIVNYGKISERVFLLEKQLGDTDQDKITRSIEQMEYLILDGIRKVTLEDKLNLAVLNSHQTSINIKIADLLQSLQPYYNLIFFDLKNPEVTSLQSLNNLKRFDALLISNPNEPFNQTEKYILDQYGLQGRGILWLINGIGIDRDSLFNDTGKTFGFPLELNLDDYFFNMGIKLNKVLVQDLYCAPLVLASGSQNNTQYIPYPWPYYPLPKPVSNLIGKEIGPVLAQFSSPLDTIKSGLDRTVLLQTSSFTKTDGVPTLISLEQATQKINSTQFNESSKILGLLSEGSHKSLFANRIKPFDYIEHQDKGKFKTILYGDGNFGENQIDKGSPLQLGYDKWTSNLYGNKQLIMNSIHYLSGKKEMLLIRKKKWNFAYLDSQKIAKKATLWKLVILFTPILMSLGIGWIIQRRRSKHLFD